MIDAILGLDTLQLLLLVVAALLVLAVGAALVTRALVRRGRRPPWMVALVNTTTDRAVALVKRPLTIAVLDEVADVIQVGRYTGNIADALIENRRELKALVAEKVREDPNVRLINKLPMYDSVVDHVSETTLRVLVEMLQDPRMDEVVSDLLRNNLQQIKLAVRERQHEQVGRPEPPDASAPGRQRAAANAATRR